MPVNLRKFASASARWASCSSPRIFSAISVASTTGALPYRGPLGAIEHRLVSPHGLGEAHDKSVSGQFVTNRGLGDGGQCRDQRRQVAQVEVVPDVDDEAQFSSAFRRGGAGAQQGHMVALAKRGGVSAGVDFDPVGPGVVHRGYRGGVGVNEQDNAAAERL